MIKKFNKIVIYFSLLAFILALVGCGSKYENDPVNIGRGTDDLKKSKCACNLVYEHGKWL